MKLSIVIPTHNTRALVEGCVQSALVHTAAPEILVVDDASQDDTVPALAGLAAGEPRLRVLRLETRGGFARAANHGLAQTSGDLLLLLNSDTELSAGAQAAIESIFAADERLGIVGANLHYPDGTPQWSGGSEPGLLWLFALSSGLGQRLGAARKALTNRSREDAHNAQWVDWVSGAAMVLRRRVYAEFGGLDESFAFYAQDLDYCRRAADAGWGVAIAPQLRVCHLHGATVGGVTSGSGRQQLDVLWNDLFLWFERRHGTRRAGRGRLALVLGARLRLALTRRAEEKEAVRRALASLRRVEIHG